MTLGAPNQDVAAINKSCRRLYYIRMRAPGHSGSRAPSNSGGLPLALLRTPVRISWMSDQPTIQAQTFSGHESFPLRFTWLTKAVRKCETPKMRDLFSRDDAVVHLGVGKNMVRSIRFWAVNTGMLEPVDSEGRAAWYQPSVLGALLFGSEGYDPFMEDPGTIWLLHWQLATKRHLGTWFWVFNELREVEFQRSAIVRELLKTLKLRSDKQVAEETLERDVDCLLRTYVPSDPDKRFSREELLDCPLTELGLVRRSGERDTFTFLRGSHESLSLPVFAYALLSFWDIVAPKSNTLRFDQIAFLPGSPGQVFKLSENAAIALLHDLSELTKGRVRFDETSGLRQVLRDEAVNPLGILKKHYQAGAREVSNVARR